MELDANFWRVFIVIGVAGVGVGLGLVLGAFTARYLRRYMREEKLNGTSQREDRNGQ